MQRAGHVRQIVAGANNQAKQLIVCRESQLIAPIEQARVEAQVALYDERQVLDLLAIEIAAAHAGRRIQPERPARGASIDEE